jgi:uncharacterized protein with HEPN domain
VRRERERLLDILEAIERIEKYAEGGKETFESDELIQTWIVHHIEIIGEACRSLSNDFQATFSNIPWADIVGMRNILIHHYFGIDTNAVWSVVEKDLPELKLNIQEILKNFES